MLKMISRQSNRKRLSSKQGLPLLLLILSSLIAVSTGSALSLAQQKSAQDQDEGIKLRADLVTLNASVTDKNGNIIRSLKAKDFIVNEDGVKQEISHFAAMEAPFSLMLLLDVSGSTVNEIGLINRAAKNFLTELGPDDRIGVIVFAGEARLIASFNDSRLQAEAAIDWVASAEGEEVHRFGNRTGTAFYDALCMAVQSGQFKRSDTRTAIVCLSDGVDSTSKREYIHAARAVERSQASVYFLNLDTEAATLAGLLKPKTDPTYINFSVSQLNRYYDEFEPDSLDRMMRRETMPLDLREQVNAGLYKLARREQREIIERTGGRFYQVRSLGDLAGVYKQVADDLRTQYSIGYYPSDQGNDGNWRTIRVEVRNRDATVRTRSGYWAK